MLTNPSEVDNLILAGKEKDCSTQDCSLPTFSEGNLDYSLCDEGIINIKGEIDGDITDGSIFNLDISPESYGDCNISISTKTIECYNKEEIEDNKIIIPETIVRDKDNTTELFKLKKIISDTDDISCAINNNLHSKIIEPTNQTDPINNQTTNQTDPVNNQTTNQTTIVDTTEPTSKTIETTTPSNTTQPKSNPGYNYRTTEKKGLSGGALIAIIVSIAAVLIAIATVIILMKKGIIGGKKPVIQPSIENSTNLDQTVGKMKVQV